MIGEVKLLVFLHGVYAVLNLCSSAGGQGQGIGSMVDLLTAMCPCEKIWSCVFMRRLILCAFSHLLRARES